MKSRPNLRTVRLPAEARMRAFGLLYENDVLTDCTFFCRDGAVRAHRIVLASSSGYFREVFTGCAAAQPNAVLIMLGVGVSQLRRLLELIYTGKIDVPADGLDEIYRLAGELKVTGLAVEEDLEETQPVDNRDTRFKGTKRVAVDYDDDDLSPTPSPKAAKSCSEKSRNNERSPPIQLPSLQPPIEHESPVENGLLLNSQLGLEESYSDPSEDLELNPSEDSELNTSRNNIVTRDDSFRDDENYVGHSVDETCKLSVWARRERKFKCELCPSSFKRASHLSRHQLVHTGERPFACDRCEKAFSRHDKLKHHINKAHDPRRSPPALPPEALYTIQHVEVITPTPMAAPPMKTEEVAATTSQKKGRGRPRKYPKVPPSAVKRPRGRPRIRPIVPIAERTPKRPRGRPRVHPIVKNEATEAAQPQNRVPETNNPESFNEETSESKMSIECGLMEPLVEIKTERPSNGCGGDGPTDSNHFFENIGLFENSSAIGKIGECTISVATTTTAATATPGEPARDDVLQLNEL